MLRLRGAWLVAIGCVAAIGGGCALLMRTELVDPGPTLSPAVFSRALPLHALTMLGVLVAAFVAIPTLIIRPGRGACVLGCVALATWAAVMALFTVTAFAPEDWLIGSPFTPGLLRVAVGGLALGVGVAATQLAASLPANTGVEHRRSAAAAIGGILALAVAGIPLAMGKLPTTPWLMVASTLTVGSAIPALLGAGAAWIVWRAVVPCLATAWATMVLLGGASDVHIHDTVAMLAPFPVLGGAVLSALFAAVHDRHLRPRLARVAAVMFAGGTIATSAMFLLLGTRGLPRRYQQYLDDHQPAQILVGVALVVTVAGATAAVRSTRAR